MMGNTKRNSKQQILMEKWFKLVRMIDG